MNTLAYGCEKKQAARVAAHAHACESPRRREGRHVHHAAAATRGVHCAHLLLLPARSRLQATPRRVSGGAHAVLALQAVNCSKAEQAGSEAGVMESRLSWQAGPAKKAPSSWSWSGLPTVPFDSYAQLDAHSSACGTYGQLWLHVASDQPPFPAASAAHLGILGAAAAALALRGVARLAQVGECGARLCGRRRGRGRGRGRVGRGAHAVLALQRGDKGREQLGGRGRGGSAAGVRAAACRARRSA